MWQQSRPNIKYELLIGINGGVSQKGKIWGWKRKYSGCLDFYSDVHEDSNDIWSPVILVQYGRHLGVLANKVIKNLKINCNIFRSLIISILLLTICFFIHIFNLNLNKVVWFIRNFGILKEDFRKRAFCHLLICEISISPANWNAENPWASLIFLMILMSWQWALLMSTW